MRKNRIKLSTSKSIIKELIQRNDLTYAENNLWLEQFVYSFKESIIKSKDGIKITGIGKFVLIKRERYYYNINTNESELKVSKFIKFIPDKNLFMEVRDEKIW